LDESLRFLYPGDENSGKPGFVIAANSGTTLATFRAAAFIDVEFGGVATVDGR
jgi:hypothetical protein